MGPAPPRLRGTGRAGLDRQVCQTAALLPNCGRAVHTVPVLPSQPTPRAAHPTDVRTLARRRLTERLPLLYPLAVRLHQARRHVVWLTSDARWATRATGTPELPVRVKKHGSLLLR